jgi:hypothetical protein
MANIGANETYHGYFVKGYNITIVDSFLKDHIDSTTTTVSEQMQAIRYRYLDESERLAQPLPAWLKGKMESLIYTSDTNIAPRPNDFIFTEDGRKHLITNVMAQRQLGAYAFSKAVPFILQLE